jgi:hypothetical protein
VAGSLPFLYRDSVTVLRLLRSRYGEQIWKRYGFVDAFNPLVGWASRDVLGIDVGISLLMAENARSQFVWQTFMKNPESRLGMERAGFSPVKQVPLLYAVNQPAALGVSTGRKLVSTAARRLAGKS